MASTKHQPAADAPTEEWQEHLRGLRYLPDSDPKPFANYVSFHGHWVPPRLAKLAATEDAPKRAPRRRKLEHGIDPAWYDFDNLVLLHRHHRDVFDSMRGRIADVERAAARGADPERVAEQRERLAVAVESGLLNQAAADRELATWADAEGIRVD